MRPRKSYSLPAFAFPRVVVDREPPILSDDITAEYTGMTVSAISERILLTLSGVRILLKQQQLLLPLLLLVAVEGGSAGSVRHCEPVSAK